MPDAADRPARTSSSLSEYLTALRGASGLTLRQVEEATDRLVSNAYLSQIENGKIQQPSPNILHALADVYGVKYEELMERAGYLRAVNKQKSDARHGRVATFAIKDVSKEEEEAILQYAAFLKSQRKRV
jgi:HTH-type transcriptional regulator, competence development regulator